MIEVIRTKCPKANIIWASSTPVTTEAPAPIALNPQINPNIIAQNRMAAKVMAEMNVPVSGCFLASLWYVQKCTAGNNCLFHSNTSGADSVPQIEIAAYRSKSQQ